MENNRNVAQGGFVDGKWVRAGLVTLPVFIISRQLGTRLKRKLLEMHGRKCLLNLFKITSGLQGLKVLLRILKLSVSSLRK